MVEGGGARGAKAGKQGVAAGERDVEVGGGGGGRVNLLRAIVTGMFKILLVSSNFVSCRQRTSSDIKLINTPREVILCLKLMRFH